MRQFSVLVVAGMLFVGLNSGAAYARTELLVYTAVEADELAKFKREFENDYPDIEIKWVRDSTGIITSKLLAEKDNPKDRLVYPFWIQALQTGRCGGDPYRGLICIPRREVQEQRRSH